MGYTSALTYYVFSCDMCTGEHNRLRGDLVVLHRLHDDSHAERERDSRVLQHHPHHAAVQAHPPLTRAQDPRTHLQGIHTSWKGRPQNCPFFQGIRAPTRYAVHTIRYEMLF